MREAFTGMLPILVLWGIPLAPMVYGLVVEGFLVLARAARACWRMIVRALPDPYPHLASALPSLRDGHTNGRNA